MVHVFVLEMVPKWKSDRGGRDAQNTNYVNGTLSLNHEQLALKQYQLIQNLVRNQKSFWIHRSIVASMIDSEYQSQQVWSILA